MRVTDFFIMVPATTAPPLAPALAVGEPRRRAIGDGGEKSMEQLAALAQEGELMRSVQDGGWWMVGCWPERETRGDSAQVEPGRVIFARAGGERAP